MLDRHTDRGIKSFANKPNVYVLVKFVEIMTAFAQVSMHRTTIWRVLWHKVIPSAMSKTVDGNH